LHSPLPTNNILKEQQFYRIRFIFNFVDNQKGDII